MFDEVRIVRKKDYISVFDGTACVHFGNRPVDRNFADRVYSKMEAMGYKPTEFKGETTFAR